MTGIRIYPALVDPMAEEPFFLDTFSRSSNVSSRCYKKISIPGTIQVRAPRILVKPFS